MKKIRFIDNTNNAHITEVTDHNQLNGVNRGDIISPFSTPRGKVKWRVDYIEQVDLDLKFVYVTQLGFEP